MRLDKDYVLSTISGQTFLVPVGAAVADDKKMMCLNESGLFIINCLKEKDCSVEEIIEKLKNEYDAHEDVIRTALEEFIKKGKDVGFIID